VWIGRLFSRANSDWLIPELRHRSIRESIFTLLISFSIVEILPASSCQNLNYKRRSCLVGYELNVYLLDNDLKDIFSLFIQNIIEDVFNSVTENEAITTTLNIVSKWKKLFDKINFNGLSIEQQKGLIGELLFFNYLLNNKKTSASILNAWTGADFEDKDFVFNAVGVEIKLTSSKNPKIRITSERQLDNENLDELFLILYITEEVKENGFSLNSLIDQIRKKISVHEERNFFNERLLLLGYREDEREYYNKMYFLKKTFTFRVTSNFPKIVKSQLSLGIYNTSYSIELSAVESFITVTETIIEKI
jgi:hypothetical protein